MKEKKYDEIINSFKVTPRIIKPRNDSWHSYVIFKHIPFLNDVLARAYYLNGDLDKAITEYEKLITFDPNSEDRGLIHPKLHYRLAKLYEEKGEKQKAIDRYQKFLNIWKNADEDLPEKNDAKERLTNLKKSKN